MSELTEHILPNQVQQFQLQCNNPQMDGQISTQEQVQGFKAQELCYKSRLQHVTQKAKLPLPSYRTTQEYPSLKFSGSVEVDGEIFTSSNTFSTRKAAELDAAKLAFDSISEKIKNGAFKKTKDEGFPPIHEDRVFCKVILHEYAMKKNLEKPTYDTVRVECVVPLHVSSLVFDGVKYTGEPSVHKKEAEQLAARAVILSILANSKGETTLYEIVKSKAKHISAINPNSSVTHLRLSGSDTGESVIKDRSDNVQQCGDMTRNVSAEELQQQSASKKARIPENATESCVVVGNENVSSTIRKQSSPAPLLHKFMKPNLETLPQPSFLPQPSMLQNSETFPQPSLLPSTQTLPQPSFPPNVQTLPQPSLPPNIQTQSQSSLLSSTQTLPQSSLAPNIQTQSQSSLLPSTQIVLQPSSQSSFPISPHTPLQSSLLMSTQTLPQPSLPPNNQTQSQPSLLPSTQILLQPSSQSSFPISPHTPLQSSLLMSTQTLPQPSLPPNNQTQSQPSLLPSTQILLQPSSQSSFPISPHPPLQSSLLTNSQALPQLNRLPTTFIPSFETQTLSNETASSRKRKKKKANKKAKNAMPMEASNSNVLLSQVPSSTISQNVLSSYQ